VAIGHNPYDGIFGSSFNVDGDFEGWVPTQVDNPAVSNGVLSGDTTTNDPMLSNAGSFSVPGDDIAYIIVRMKKSPTATTGAEYFWSNEDGNYHPVRWNSFATINDGQFHTYFSSPSSSANAASWLGKTINGLRFDPNRAADGSSFEIDFIIFSDGDFDNDGVDDLDEGGDNDLDGDGLSSWEDTDSDNDGSSDAAERIAGTSPIDPQSLFKVTSVLPMTGTPGIELGWNTVSGRIYRVHGSTNQLSSFEVLQDNIAYPQNRYTDTVYAVEDSAFYQIDVDLE